MSELIGTQLTQLLSTQDELGDSPEKKKNCWGKLIGNSRVICKRLNDTFSSMVS
jgi:hypothetical protein